MTEGVYIDKILDYLRRNIKKGYTLEGLKWALIGQGYPRSTVERAINRFNLEMAKSAPVLKEKPVIRHHIIDENNIPIEVKKPWWKRIFK